MHLLDAATIVTTGLMVGNELAVSAFVNPAMWQLESASQAQGLSFLARSLGRVMPVWYCLCLTLLALESFLHRHQAAWAPFLAATVIWVGVIVYTIGMLVSINNRIASLSSSSPAAGWEQEHKRWDALHRVRILLLAIALFALAYALTV